MEAATERVERNVVRCARVADYLLIYRTSSSILSDRLSGRVTTCYFDDVQTHATPASATAVSRSVFRHIRISDSVTHEEEEFEASCW